MRRNIHVMYKNFRGIVLTKTLLGFEGRLNPAQLKKELEDKNIECSLVVGWSLYEPDEATVNSHRHRLWTCMTVLKN